MDEQSVDLDKASVTPNEEVDCGKMQKHRPDKRVYTHLGGSGNVLSGQGRCDARKQLQSFWSEDYDEMLYE